jgi:hypothetical protein
VSTLKLLDSSEDCQTTRLCLILINRLLKKHANSESNGQKLLAFGLIDGLKAHLREPTNIATKEAAKTFKLICKL